MSLALIRAQGEFWTRNRANRCNRSSSLRIFKNPLHNPPPKVFLRT